VTALVSGTPRTKTFDEELMNSSYHEGFASRALLQPEFIFIELNKMNVPLDAVDTSTSWRTRNVKVLSAVSFAQDTASDMLYPILPIFLSTVLGAPASVIGAVEGAAEGAAALTKLVAGRISDRIPRRPLIALGYGAAALGKILVAVASIWPIVLLGRVVDRLGKGLRGPPRDSLLVDGIDRSQRGRVIGFHRTADTMGAVVGPLIGLGAISLFDGDLRKVLYLAIVPAIVSVLLISLVKDPRSSQRRSTKAPLVPTSLPANLKKLITLLTVFGMANFPDALLLLRAHEIGMSVSAIVVAYVIFNLSYAMISYPIGALSDRYPRHHIYALGLICFAITYLGIAHATSATQVLGLLVIYGVFSAIQDVVGKSWVSKLASDETQGWAQGLFQGTTGGAILIAGIWAGLTWNIGSGGGRVPLVISGCVAILIATTFLLVGSRLSHTEREHEHDLGLIKVFGGSK
jgi:MFS family permease